MSSIGLVPGITEEEAKAEAQGWLRSTEIIYLNVGTSYIPHDSVSTIHGVEDGTHGSPRLSMKELMIKRAKGE